MKKLSLLAVALLATAPMLANAESTFTTGAGTPITANARLDFRVTIPKILFLQVSTGTNMATNSQIDLIDFTVPAANVGNGTPVAATAASGDLANGTVTAKLLGNNGNISLSSNTIGAMNSGGTDTISYSQINTAVAANVSATVLAAPALADGVATNVAIAPNVGAKVVNQDAKWTYTYKNTAIVPPGTYGGVNTNNGRVTYTASMP
ncbi:MAG: hypothetical protein JF567_08380 [Xanthomonadales bacterium]|nr:hypothetical protein [Xanthomonadales bacterium]